MTVEQAISNQMMNESLQNFESHDLSTETASQWNTLSDVPFTENEQAETTSEPPSEIYQPNELHHPRAEQLTTLQESLQQAKINGDTVAADRIKNVMKMVVDRNRLEVTPEQWDVLSNDERKRFYEIKMQEAKILDDKDEFDFWSANYQDQKNKKDSISPSGDLEKEQPRFEVVPFSEITKDLEDPRYEELGHGTISAENAQSILSEGLKVGGPGRDTDIDSYFLPFKNAEQLMEKAQEWPHNDAKFIVLYRIPFEYKIPNANSLGIETYKMFYDDNGEKYGSMSGTYNKDFAYGYLDANTGLVYKNPEYKGDLDDPEQKAAMENKYQFLRNETANKITDPEEREGFLAMADSWHEMGENMSPKQVEQQPEPIPTTEKDQALESAAEEIAATVERDSGRTKVASGEMSSIYQIEKSDGETFTQVDSEYFKIAEQFMNSHPNIKNNFDLSLAMSGLATDLSLVDATQGRNLANGNADQKANLVKDYSKLKAALDDPDVPDTDKQAINDYFKSLEGNALSQMQSTYDEISVELQDRNQKAKSEQEQKTKLDHYLEEAKSDLENLKIAVGNDSEIFNKVLTEVNDLLQAKNKSIDIDILEERVNSLDRAYKELQGSAMKFAQKNLEYEMDTTSDKDHLSKQQLLDMQRYVADNESFNSDMAKNTSGIDDRIRQIRQYISNIRDSARN